MIKSFRKIYPIYYFIDLIFIVSSFYFVYIFKYNSLKDISTDITLYSFKEYSFIFILWAMFIIISFRLRKLYFTDRSLSIPKEIFRVIISIFDSSVLIGLIIFFAQYKFFSRLIFIEYFVCLCILLSGWRVVKRLSVRGLVARGFHNINILMVGFGNTGKVVLEEIKKNPWWGFKVVGFLDDDLTESLDGVPYLGKIKDFPIIANKNFVDEVIITVPFGKKVITGLIEQARKIRLGIRMIPENIEESLPILDISYLGVLPLFTYKERERNPAEFALKRIFDFMLSLLCIVILFPLFVIIAIFIKLDSKGPVLYVQKRAGLKGNLFKFYKFRSMIKDADRIKHKLLERNEIKDGVIFKIREDPRITRVGRFLRRYSLDELPQLFNVLRGDISLIGPRPPIPEEVKQYNHVHMQRLSIKPGITGLSQVRGRSELTFRKWVKWDIWYTNNWSFGLDLKILWWTIPTVLKGKGAY